MSTGWPRTVARTARSKRSTSTARSSLMELQDKLSAQHDLVLPNRAKAPTSPLLEVLFDLAMAKEGDKWTKTIQSPDSLESKGRGPIVLVASHAPTSLPLPSDTRGVELFPQHSVPLPTSVDSAGQAGPPWALHAGAAVTALAFSDVVRGSGLQSDFTVLAVGTEPRGAPPLQFRMLGQHHSPGRIQLWKIPLVEGEAPRLAVVLEHPGYSARCVRWISGIADHSRRVGFLYTVTNSATVLCWAIPKSWFDENSKEVRSIRPSAVWEWSDPDGDAALTVDIVWTDGTQALKVLVGHKSGKITLLYLRYHHKDDFQNPVEVSPAIFFHAAGRTNPLPVHDVRWSPYAEPVLFAVSTFSGSLQIWDSRRPHAPRAIEVDAAHRPLAAIAWSHLTRYILSAHTSGMLFNLVTNESTLHTSPRVAPVERAAASPSSAWFIPVRKSLESPCRSCATMGPIGALGFQDGCIIFGNLLNLERKAHKLVASIMWRLCPKDDADEEHSTDPSEDKTAAVDDVSSENTAALFSRFQAELAGMLASDRDISRQRLEIVMQTVDNLTSLLNKKKKVTGVGATPKTGIEGVPSCLAVTAVAMLDCWKPDVTVAQHPLLAMGGELGVILVVNISDFGVL